MKWVLEKQNKYNKDDNNYFWQFLNLSISIEEQLRKLEDLKLSLPTEEHLGIDLQKHFLMIAALIEAGTIVPHDESREQYIEPASYQLNKSAIQLYEQFF
ncbi:MAG: hypothetical protein EAZ08_03545 [Cytophagales bacterium]|nr:MAG: hypothetical protein EAZ08_03545 [Cytophagales bacterium]